MTDHFDKFTTDARKTLQLAQEEARKLNHHYIGTEHMLLGLLLVEEGIAARVLGSLGVEVDSVRESVESSIGRGDYPPVGEMGLTPRAKRVIEFAVEEARHLKHRQVGTEHLLLGIVREREGIATGVLASHGVPLKRVRAKVLEVLQAPQDTGDVFRPTIPAPDETRQEAKPTGFDRFTERARKVLQLAQEEAQRFNHNYIGTEHILLGLVREEQGVAARVLLDLGVDLHRVRSVVEPIIGRGDRVPIGEIGLTPRAKNVIEYAVDESRRLNHNYIGTEHLLLGLVREGEGIAAGVLESLGASLFKVHGQVIEVLKASGGSSVIPDDLSFRRANALDLLKTMFDYTIWARDQLLAAAEKLEESRLREGDKQGVYGSIHDTLAHLAVSEWLWLQRCMGESPLRLPTGEDFASLRVLIDWWNDTHAQAVQYLNSITDYHLNQELTYMAPDGKQRTRKAWHMLMQVVNHQTEHRAQIATMLGQLGVEVPQTDLVVFLSQR